MSYLDIVYFSVLLLLALTALSQWKRRRDAIAARLNRGLVCYVSGKRDVSTQLGIEDPGAFVELR